MNMMRFLLMVAACVVVLAFSERPAEAQNCSISNTQMSFGSIQTTTGGAFDSTATITANCSGFPIFTNTVYICAHFGDGSGGSVNGNERTMSGSGGTLRYNLYTDNARTNMWGSSGWGGVPPPKLSVSVGAISGSGSATWTIYGRTYANQKSVSQGAYSSNLSGGHVNFRVGTSNAACTAAFGVPASVQPNLNVTANVLAGCTITTTDVNFGSTGMLTAAVQASGSVRLTCTNNLAYTVDLVVPAGRTSTTRTMSKGSETVTYGLYKDTARTSPWGDAGSQRQTGTGNGLQQILNVYGRVPAQATPSSGEYVDTVIVNVTY